VPTLFHGVSALFYFTLNRTPVQIFLAGNISVLNQIKAVPSNLALFPVNPYLNQYHLICPVTYYYKFSSITAATISCFYPRLDLP